MPHALDEHISVAVLPSVYAGDEYGWTGIKEQRLGGDDAVRPEFPPRPPDASELDAGARGILDAHRTLIALRRRHPWLTRAQTDVVHLANEQLVLRSGTAGAAVVVALNLAGEPVELPAADATTVECGTGRLAGDRVQLPARGWAVLSA